MCATNEVKSWLSCFVCWSQRVIMRQAGTVGLSGIALTLNLVVDIGKASPRTFMVLILVYVFVIAIVRLLSVVCELFIILRVQWCNWNDVIIYARWCHWRVSAMDKKFRYCSAILSMQGIRTYKSCLYRPKQRLTGRQLHVFLPRGRKNKWMKK